MTLVLNGLTGTGQSLPVDGLGEWDDDLARSQAAALGRPYDFTQGDPLISVGPDGASLSWKDGQPVMDQGLVNSVLIALFTDPNWAGNAFLGKDEQIGSDFIATCRGPLTLSKLATIEQAASLALDGELYKSTVTATNPSGAQVKVNARLVPPNGNAQTLVLTRNGQNWINQAVRG